MVVRIPTRIVLIASKCVSEPESQSAIQDKKTLKEFAKILHKLVINHPGFIHQSETEEFRKAFREEGTLPSRLTRTICESECPSMLEKRKQAKNSENPGKDYRPGAKKFAEMLSRLSSLESRFANLERDLGREYPSNT